MSTVEKDLRELTPGQTFHFSDVPDATYTLDADGKTLHSSIPITDEFDGFFFGVLVSEGEPLAVGDVFHDDTLDLEEFIRNHTESDLGYSVVVEN